jgi:heme/copper-type cytochrome/quinol oxidase subunit 4
MHLHHPHHEIKPREKSQKHSKHFWYWVIGVCVASLIALIAFSHVTQSRIEEKKKAHDQRYQVSDIEVLTEQVDLV